VKRVDGYLSRRAQNIWPGALVSDTQGPDGWILERPGEEDVALGENFHRAHQALTAMIRAETDRRNAGREPSGKEQGS